MSDYDNTNTGALFKNDKKEKENHPDYRGKINVDGTDKSLSAWIKKDRNGNSYMSIAVSNPYVPNQETQTAPKVDLDDDIPF